VSVEYDERTMAFGISSDELVWGFASFMNAAASRIYGTGSDQYEKRDKDGKPFQAFEEMTPLELLQMAREEVQDLGVYAAMLDIRLARLTAAFVANATVGDAR
jgi:hypothetical protein